jgi:hypothetical protein
MRTCGRAAKKRKSRAAGAASHAEMRSYAAST